MKKYIYILFCACALLSCQRASRLAQYWAEKHARDSVSLTEQERSMAYYHNQLDSLLPVADSLITYFTYEKNEQEADKPCGRCRLILLLLELLVGFASCA